MKLLKNLLFLLSLFLISHNSYSSESDSVKTNSDDFETSNYEDEIYDPLEPINRAIFSFNNTADKIILEPVAKGYKKLPSPIQSGIGNFLNNLKMPLVIVNQLLQGQGRNRQIVETKEDFDGRDIFIDKAYYLHESIISY